MMDVRGDAIEADRPKIAAALQQSTLPSGKETVPFDVESLSSAAGRLLQRLDPRYGGFGYEAPTGAGIRVVLLIIDRNP